MINLKMIMGAGVCAVALCFGLSVSAAESGAGKGIEKAGKVLEPVADAIAPSVEILPGFEYGGAEQVEAYTRLWSDTADGVSGILGGSANSENIGKALHGIGIIGTPSGLNDMLSSGVNFSGVNGIVNSTFGGPKLSNIGTAIKNFKNMNSLSDLTNLKNLGNVGMSFLKDMSPEIKQLMGMAFDDLGLDSMIGGLGGGGYPVLMPTNSAQSAAAVGTSKAQTAATEGLLDAETDLTASFGPVGNMDGRMGQCSINGEDYSQPISYWLQAVGPKLEGTCPWLYLDTYCWPTIGVGTLLGKDLKTMYQTFMAMEYVDANGNPLDKRTQEADLRQIYNLHVTCRSKLQSDPAGAKEIYNYSCGGNHWKNMFNGRRISDQAMQSASFDEICKGHAKVWANYWKQLGKNYTDLPLLHQVFVVDVSYQAGAGAVKGNNRKYLPNRTPVWQNLASGNCGGAASAFSGQRLCTEFSSRCQQRKAMITQGCGGS